MGTYNILTTTIRCPHCGTDSEMDINLYFGYLDLIQYKLMGRYAWWPRKAVHNGGRPADGNLDGEGYTECPACSCDFFVVVHVRADVIMSVEPDTTRPGYMQSCTTGL